MNTDGLQIDETSVGVEVSHPAQVNQETKATDQKAAVTDLSIIVVSYNTANLLRACLQSVYANSHAQYSAEVIVVDNASPDNSAEVVRLEFPQARLIANSENKGFAAANNQALELATGKYVVLLNPDTEVIGPALWKMVAFLEAYPQAAVVGPALIYPDGAFQEGSFHFPGLFQIFFDFFPLNWRLTRSRLNGRYPRHHYEGAYPRAYEIDFPLGACLMLRREVLEQVGPMDEAFFMYMEEIDWCYRIKAARNPVNNHPWKIYCLPAAKIIHHAGASSRQFRDEMFYQLYKSRAYFYRKHYSRPFQTAARWLTRLGLAKLFLAGWLNQKRGKISREEFTARKRAYGRVWRLS
jgi:GT2 family glycosyltransferase